MTNYVCSFPVWETIEVHPDDSVADEVQAHVKDVTGEETIVEANLITGSGWVCHPDGLLTPFKIGQIATDDNAVPAASAGQLH